MQISAIFRVFLGVSSLWVLGGSAHADIFVYQIPGGARIVTDHPLNNRDYKLVRQSRTSKGAGTLLSSRNLQYVITDPNAYDRLIRRIAAAHRIDAALVKAVMHVESAFNPHAVSHKGAQGLMQLMPDTAQRYGARDLFDPSENVRAGVLYLKDLQKMFPNNPRYVLAAYNAGENAVLRHKGIPPYDETRDYVQKVMKMHRQYAALQNPAVPTAPKGQAAATPAPTPTATTSTPTPATLVPVAAVQSARSPEKNL